MNQKKTDWFLILFWVLFISGIVLTSVYYITKETNNCSSDPAQYLIDDIKEQFNEEADLVYGYVIVVFKNGKTITAPFGDAEIVENTLYNYSK